MDRTARIRAEALRICLSGWWEQAGVEFEANRSVNFLAAGRARRATDILPTISALRRLFGVRFADRMLLVAVTPK